MKIEVSNIIKARAHAFGTSFILNAISLPMKALFVVT